MTIFPEDYEEDKFEYYPEAENDQADTWSYFMGEVIDDLLEDRDHSLIAIEPPIQDDEYPFVDDEPYVPDPFEDNFEYEGD